MKTKLYSTVFLSLVTLFSLESCRKNDHTLHPHPPPPPASQCRLLSEVDTFPSIETDWDPLAGVIQEGLAYSQVKITLFQYGSNDSWTGETDSAFYSFNDGKKGLEVHTLNLSYDGSGYLTNNNNQWYTKDKEGGTTTFSHKTEYQYADGKMVKQIDDYGTPNQPTSVSYAYDAQGNLATAVYSSGDTIAYNYVNGSLKQVTYFVKITGTKTTYPVETDGQGRLLKRKFTDGSEEDYTYDGNGNMLEMKNIGPWNTQAYAISDFSYDNMKNPLQFSTWDNLLGDTWTSLWNKNKGFPNPQIIDPATYTSNVGFYRILAPANNITAVSNSLYPQYNVKYTNTYDSHGNLTRHERPASTGEESGYVLRADFTYTGCH